MTGFTHWNEAGETRMVHVGDKPVTRRFARAECFVSLQPATLKAMTEHAVAKGNVLEVARLAGILAAKRTDELIPLCHSVPLDGVEIDFETSAETDESAWVRIVATARTEARTGVEMEALTAVSIAGLTIYDMCKAVDRGMIVGPMRLIEKSGGRSGHFLATRPLQPVDATDNP